jgi:hypothetical protein
MQKKGDENRNVQQLSFEAKPELSWMDENKRGFQAQTQDLLELEWSLGLR